MTPCCDSHVEPVCCDPMDCGPCCPNCPTCPTLHPEFLSWLGPAERRILADTASTRAHFENDPRYWTTETGRTGMFPDNEPRAAQSYANQLRWAHIAARLDPDRYRDLPERFYRQQLTIRGIALS